MSSSDRRTQATAWSLDEFAAFDMFAPMPQTSHEDVAGGMSEHDFDMRFAAEAARLESDAYARGRADGERTARASLDGVLATAMQALTEAAHSVRLHESLWLANAEENIAAIAVLVARHIVGREIATDPSFVTALVQQSIEQYPVDQEITVRLHPDDLAVCRGTIAQDKARPVRWIADATIVRGGCLTEGRERIIDGRIDTALERAYRNIAGVQPS